MSPRVVVVGSANADLVVTVPHRPVAGETVLGGDLHTGPGGKGANQAVAAALLGALTAFVGRVGDDAHGRLLLASLRAAGVDTTGVAVDPAPTGVALVTLTPDGDNSIVVSPGANARVTPADAERPVVREAAVLLLQREIDPEASLAAARCCRGRVVLNLAPSGPVPPPLLERTDVLVVNQHEAADLLGQDSTVHDPSIPDDPSTHDDRHAVTAGRLRSLGPAAVVITLGAAGAVAADATGTFRIPAPAVRAVDTTGAGDAFTGALGWRLACGDDLAAAVSVAVRVGALAVTRRGAQRSFPTAARLDQD